VRLKVEMKNVSHRLLLILVHYALPVWKKRDPEHLLVSILINYFVILLLFMLWGEFRQ